MAIDSKEWERFKANLPADWNERSKIFSAVVREGMERVTAEFSSRIEPFGFRRKRKTLLWARQNSLTADLIGLHRDGSSYGAPLGVSVDIRMMFSISVLNDPDPLSGVNGPWSDHVRNARGYGYGLHFNAKTWDAYEVCINGLVACLTEHGEPWFTSCRDGALIGHPELREESASRLQEAVRGKSDPEIVSANLVRLGLRPPVRRKIK
jgi:hypothetical protein